MRMSRLVGRRIKEDPKDARTVSHKFLIRGGYIRPVSAGIYSLLPIGKRIVQKIEAIIREEMNRIDGQEVLMPVVLPAELWEESGRYQSVGQELLRFVDRNGKRMLLAMTHEEAIVQLVRSEINSYKQLPVMLYQIQTKYRDEARPRAGMIRVREFTMKDAYSFHTSQADLEAYYSKCHKAYERIYARVGLPEVISIASDSGMMGGSVSHEFMLLTPIGEDSIAICTECDYRANMEAAECIVQNETDAVSSDLTLVHTPNSHTIEEVCEFLHCDRKTSCKAVVYQRNSDDHYIVLFIRGDLEVNEAKLTNYLGYEVHPANITAESGLSAGYIGPVNLRGDFTVLYDRSLKGMNNLCCGANVPEYHYTGLSMSRDVQDAQYHDFAKIQQGGICPHCGKPAITISRGIEVGNIFQLGTKYTKAMHMTYIDSKGETQYPIMGCYGIGIGRLAASICEAHHDAYGPIWPLSVAPWQVHICAVRADDAEVKAYADKLYQKLQNKGVEVIYDDRKVSAGSMFSDADLIGVPFRIIVSPRNMKQNIVEIVSRDKSFSESASMDTAAEEMVKILEEAK